MATTTTAKAPAKKSAAKKKTTTASTSDNAPAMEQSKFHKLFVDELKDIYWAEKHLVKALPKMQKAATTVELKDAIGNHLAETKDQVLRLEQIFGLLDKKPQAKKCEAMAGLVEEGNGIVEDTDEDTMVRDAGIIMASQKIEHYEIATYGSLCALAKKMGHDEIAGLLEETLAQEKNADSILTDVALNYINEEASQE